MKHMSRKQRTVVRVLALGLALAAVMALGQGLAQEPGDSPPEDPAPREPVSVEGDVRSAFSYQGVLREDGAAVTGSRDMTFRLYSNSACTTVVSGVITKPDVPVTNGLFSVELAFSHGYFNGQELWLGIGVEGTNVACQEILPVPYALSLRPGADIVGTVDHLLEVDNTNTSGADIDTLIVRNDSGSGEAVEVAAQNNGVTSFAVNGFGVWGDSDNNHGTYGRTESVSKAGVFARGVDLGPDLILGGNANTTAGDDGRIFSDPAYGSSDIVLVSNDTIRLDLNADGSDEDADFEIRDTDDNLIFDVDDSGDLIYGGAGRFAFPRPTWDSGWRDLDPGTCNTVNHNLGGNVNNYVVDLQHKKTSGTPMGINNSGIGGDNNGATARGGSWQNLTTSSIDLCRWFADVSTHQLRVRIWVYR
jgi:hypothetical protein